LPLTLDSIAAEIYPNPGLELTCGLGRSIAVSLNEDVISLSDIVIFAELAHLQDQSGIT
jgi:hypothetical protein